MGRTVQGGLARGPEVVAVISRDLTRTYSGRCMEWDRTGLGDRAIESLRRIHLLIFESIVYYSIGGDGGLRRDTPSTLPASTRRIRRRLRSTISTCCRPCSSTHRSMTQLSPSKTFRLLNKPQNPRSYSNSTYNRATRRKSKRTRHCRLNYPLDRARGRLDKTAHALPCPL